jgi:hypothetical protein
MSMSIKKSGQRSVFLSHTSRAPHPIAYAAGRYCFLPAFPLPPVVVVHKPGSIFTRSLTPVQA